MKIQISRFSWIPASAGMTMWLALTLPFLLFAAGCGKSCNSAPKPDSGLVKIAIATNPKSLDPAFSVDVNSGIVSAKIFNGLTRFEGTNVVPDLADTWTISAAGREFSFILREGVKFHDGAALTAESVRQSFARIIDPATASPRQWVFANVDTLIVASETSLVIRLKKPSASFLTLLAMPAGYVVRLAEGVTTNSLAKSVVGTGPYQLKEWVDDDHVTLLRNDGYFEGAPKVEGILYRVVSEPSTALSLLKNGELDVYEVPDVHLENLSKDPEWGSRISTVDDLAIRFLAVNCERIKDERIRTALNLLIDRPAAAKAILRGLATPAGGAVPPAFSRLKPEPFGFDPAKAKELLAAANFDFSKPLTLLRTGTRGTVETSEAIAGFLKQAGVAVKIEPMEFSSLLERVDRSDFDLCLLSWYADYADAENFLLPLFHSKTLGSAGNRARFKDPEMDRLLDRIENSVPGPERDELIRTAEEYVRMKAPWVFLWHPRTAVAVSPRLKGFVYPAIFNADKGTAYHLD